MVLAHEYGHAIQHQARLNAKDTPTLVAEQQADCLAGVVHALGGRGQLRPLHAEHRRRAQQRAGGGDLVPRPAAQRGRLRSPTPTKHGSAFERISAFQFGFTDGAASCASIDEKEIVQRRGDLPVELQQQDQTGEWPVTEESVQRDRRRAGHPVLPGRPADTALRSGLDEDCPDARPSPPVSYCPATNTIAVDLPELAAMGTPSGPAESENGGVVSGDNTAYSVLVSRYMQALQHERGGLVLDNAEAALRTACLTGCRHHEDDRGSHHLGRQHGGADARAISTRPSRDCSPTGWPPATSTARRCRPGSPGSTRSASACSATRTAASSGSRNR